MSLWKRKHVFDEIFFPGLRSLKRRKQAKGKASRASLRRKAGRVNEWVITQFLHYVCVCEKIFKVFFDSQMFFRCRTPLKNLASRCELRSEENFRIPFEWKVYQTISFVYWNSVFRRCYLGANTPPQTISIFSRSRFLLSAYQRSNEVDCVNMQDFLMRAPRFKFSPLILPSDFVEFVELRFRSN